MGRPSSQSVQSANHVTVRRSTRLQSKRLAESTLSVKPVALDRSREGRPSGDVINPGYKIAARRFTLGPAQSVALDRSRDGRGTAQSAESVKPIAARRATQLHARPTASLSGSRQSGDVINPGYKIAARRFTLGPAQSVALDRSRDDIPKHLTEVACPRTVVMFPKDSREFVQQYWSCFDHTYYE